MERKTNSVVQTLVIFLSSTKEDHFSQEKKKKVLDLISETSKAKYHNLNASN